MEVQDKPSSPRESLQCTFIEIVLVLRFVNQFYQSFDGVRRRCLPALYKGLEPGAEDDRMKGALWTLNLSTLGTCLQLRAAPVANSNSVQPSTLLGVSTRNR